MDRFGEYAQIINLVTPPVESYGPPAVARELAQIANDGMAELVQKYPDRFLGFIAALPMNDPDGLLVEAKRAVNELGAVGVQVMSNILGRPLDKPEYHAALRSDGRAGPAHLDTSDPRGRLS